MNIEHYRWGSWVLLSLMVSLVGGLPARQVSPAQELTVFPSKRFVESFIADGPAHRFGIEKAFKMNELWGSVGGVLPVVESPVLGCPVQVSFGASAHMVLDPGESIAVISTEYYVDFFMIDVLWSDHLFTRVGMGHTSHHLGDDAVVISQRSVLDYSRDYAEGVGGYSSDVVRVYAGVNYGYKFAINHYTPKPWLFEVGGEITVHRFSKDCLGFWAFDIKFRQESGFGSTQQFRAGVQFERGEHILRIAFTYRCGLEERGQFYQQRNSFASAGLFVDL